VAGAQGDLEFAVDAAFVYWGVTGAVMRQPLAGGAPEVFAHADAPSVRGVDDAHVFWVDGELLMTASK